MCHIYSQYVLKMFILQLSFITTLALIIVSVFKWLSSTQKPNKNLPPSPSKLPVIGNFHQLGDFPQRSLRSLAQKHGPLMLLHFGSVPVLVVSSPDAAREIMKTHDLVFSSRPKTTMPCKLLYDSMDIAFCQYGEYWRQVKSIAVLNLLSNTRVQSYKSVREEEIALMIEKIIEASNENQVIELGDMLRALTNDVVCRVALGRKNEGEHGSRLRNLLVDFHAMLGVFCIGDYVPWLRWIDRVNGLFGRAEKLAKELNEFLDGVLSDHMELMKERDSIEAKNFVEILLEIQRENSLGIPLSTENIKAVILDMFAAGTDTSYIVLEWTMSELLKHPLIMNKLQKEVREVAKSKPNITEDELPKLHYLKLVIKETLRLHFPVPLLIPREATQDTRIMGYDIKAGTQVIVNAWAISRDPSLWMDPEEYRPERFLNSDIDYKGFHFEFLPFGAGRRGCPGIQFSSTVNELVLANLLYKFEWALPDGQRAEDFDMTEAPGITTHRKFPLLARARQYLNPIA